MIEKKEVDTMILRKEGDSMLASVFGSQVMVFLIIGMTILKIKDMTFIDIKQVIEYQILLPLAISIIAFLVAGVAGTSFNVLMMACVNGLVSIGSLYGTDYCHRHQKSVRCC